MPVGPPPPAGMGVPDDRFFTGTPPPPPMFTPPTPPVAEPDAGPPPSPPTTSPEIVDEPTVDATPDQDLSTETGIPVTPVGPEPGSDIPAPEDVFREVETFAASTDSEVTVLPSWPRAVETDNDTYDDDEARALDEELAKELYKASPKELQKSIAQPPSLQYVYMEQLQTTVSLPETKRMYEREMATRAVELAITAQDSGDLLASMERALAIDQSELLTKVTADDYDEFDRVVIGSRELDVKLVGESHMVRVLATKKAGKTTTILEIMRCSITGEKAFGIFDIQPLAEDETILFIDPELSPRDYEVYVKKAFTGMRPDEINRIKRYSTRNQNEDDSDGESRPAPAVFDLASESTRDVLIMMCNKYNVARIVFDSYVKLISGSTNKDDDVKRMLRNWDAVKGGTKVRESFWVGHINNSGEVRSSGSMLLDGTFESLLAITVDVTDRRFFQAQAGRMTDAMEPKEIILDPDTNRPIIMYGSSVRPVMEPEGARPPKTPKAAAVAENKVMEEDGIKKLILLLLGNAGQQPLRDGRMRYGGWGKTELISEVIAQWRTVVKFAPSASATTITTEIGAMAAKKLILSDYPLKGTKVLWLDDAGEAEYLELKGAR